MSLAHNAWQRISENLWCLEDTCNVYAIRSGDEAVLIDFGSGRALDALPEIGARRATDVLMTHHHRDQAQGLSKAVSAGVRIWVPHTEQDLFHSIDAHWQARDIVNNYNMREDRFSLLEPVPVAGTLRDYEGVSYGGRSYTVVPTPGHTTGSISLLVEIDGRLAAFTGDLIAAPGKLWSLAATQWSYNGAEGVAASIPSLSEIEYARPDLLLPSHGAIMHDPATAIDMLIERLAALLYHRQQNPRIFELISEPYERLSPHLLFNRTSMSNAYVLLSDSGNALMLDFGYDFTTGIALGADRASRRPSLFTLRALKRDFGVQHIEAALPTHYHDDHVAGFNLLRTIEGTQVWAPECFADVLRRPFDYDLPCLWYDPIIVDRELPAEQAIAWHEHRLTLYPLPGHTRYAVAIAFEVDGQRVVVTGDQYQGESGDQWNYVYRNLFEPDDYVRSAELYRRLQPDLVLSGHWPPLRVRPGFFERLDEQGRTLVQLHKDLLPEGADGYVARIQPYQATVNAGEPLPLFVEVRNPFGLPTLARVHLVVPPEWTFEPAAETIQLQPKGMGVASFVIVAPPGKQRRARLAADVSIGDRAFGQQAEALVTVTDETPRPGVGRPQDK
jgi:glyoxylase-like metal-dependent hydrolase (beta-lactamase superfamily II)